jgi:endonuclease/exonuclease/phosphatase family metal-dependent hydrolase
MIDVRTVNIWSRGPHYKQRLVRVAEKVRADSSRGAGVIGLQEVARPLRWPWAEDGASLLAGSLADLYRAKPASCRIGDLGIIAGPEWQLLSHRSWLLGRDSWLHDLGTIPYRRYLLEAELRHEARDWRLRFYTTHLSHGRQEARRLRQTLRLIDLILSRARPSELPPIVAGDFNAGSDSAVARLLEEHFTLVHADAVDSIWMGRPASFGQARGSYSVLETAVVDLMSEGLCDAHNSPRVTLSVEARGFPLRNH